MKLTFILPTYNRPHYLNRCISSMLRFAHEDIHIIIGDNSENDDSKNVIQSISSEKVKYFKNEHNLGPDGNIAKLFEHVSDGIIFCMTDDAEVEKNAYSDIKRVFDNAPSIGLLSSPFLAESEKGFQAFKDKGNVKCGIHKAGEEALKNVLPVCTSFPRIVVKRNAVDLGLYRKHIGVSLYAIQALFGSALRCLDAYHIDNILVKVSIHNTPTWRYPDDYGVYSSLAMARELCEGFPSARLTLTETVLGDIPAIFSHARHQSQEQFEKTVRALMNIPEVRSWPGIQRSLEKFGVKIRQNNSSSVS